MYNDHSLFTDTSPSGLFAPLDLSLLPDEKTALSIEGLNLHYGQTQALFDINMRIAKGQVTAFIGPSGCGKSTLLSCINRMNDLIDGCHIDGKVMLHGQNVYDKNVDVAALRRQIGMVFQRPNPFPKSIYENVVYGLRLQGVSDRRVLDDAVENSLRSAALWDEVKGRLHENAFGLSGGQQQRLVIARAIAIEPEILLLDEPTSALDPISTLTIEELINDLKAKYTVIIVTHNMQQAARVSDQTAFMHMGELVEYTSTNDIFTTPKEKRTEDYITGRYG
ncbi:phosphate ABC transporter ATP-binding protein PstB [Photobacterium aquimaris]|uniref:Phosphate ABC transporter ATP-binding protein n=1 Tax=Photobacterium aquimaris TaxID=512643 RepID=A0A2T3I0C9_9GAMM|nr:phosphate ABC transporter ATP-binding protein PstB [Photobacterium aquimaris]MCP4954952.1 phosphate ABC transporter ATP-binding protein [Photobacterium aquimaris]OBU23652.1 phosphate ABC transporter ATP-binding protein [Photobacterium aquimaris]PQJ40355.1 phosphate ABC transporter ATP-binding protein [Photobacterium aquimaris]PSU08937.1 phosphate ABC transporter ATP-binding protein [Photobacterium aquimaris]